jgi:serine/threonine protein kinase
MPLAPTRIDRYEIKGRIGGGGMGTLYLARDTNPATDRLVALKLLRTSFDSDELRRRFMREARALAELNHPNVVVIYDSGEFEDSPFIVMEYVRGETLDESIRRRAPIALGEKLRLLAELCAGLAHAHAAGIIHRDIKPANLVVDLHGRLKILDFGIARVDSDATLRPGQLTQVVVQIGTPGYMSPEQIESGEVDARSDLFAVGAVAYALVSGREAFPGATTGQIERQVLGERPVPLESSVPGLDPAVAEIIAGALEKDVRQRCQSAAELADAFDRARARLPEEGRPPRQTPPPPRPTGDRKSRHERAADVAYERAEASYSDGAEECARRFAMEAVAENPQHAGARRLLLELGRFHDVEPWLPVEPKRPSPPGPSESSGTMVAPLPPAVPAAASSSGTVVATPGTWLADSGTVVAPLPPKPPEPPKSSQPAKPPQGPTPTAARRPATGRQTGLSPAVRLAAIVGGAVVALAAAAVAVWLLWFSGPGGQTLTIVRPEGGTIEGDGVQCGTQGSQCSAAPSKGATVQLRALADAGFVFAGFTGDCAPAGRAVMNGARSCGASFVKAGLPPADPGEYLLTIDRPDGGTIEGPGIKCGTGGADCSVTEPRDADVRLTARPDSGFTLSGFTGDCAPAGATVMAGPRHCGATFATSASPTQAGTRSNVPASRGPTSPSIQWWVLTVTKPTGGTILGENIKCGAEGSECGSKYPGGYPVTLRHKAEQGYAFGEFTGDCGPAGKTVMTAARTCGATFVKESTAASAAPFFLTVRRPTDGAVVGNGIDCGPDASQCTSPQPTGASVRLMARPKPGFAFTGFTDDCDAGGVVVMTAARTCGATFAKSDSRLPAAAFPTLTVNRPRYGTVIGPGIECGSNGSRCKAPQPTGSTVLLRAQPDPGYFFVRFSGDCEAGGLTVMTGPRLCAVSFLAVKDGLPTEAGYPTLTIIKPTGGTVIGNGIECGTGGSACSAPQPAARAVQLTARPDVGFVFIRFTGDCDASGSTFMSAPHTCGALFATGG